jgi:hypothetical protein
MGGDMSVNYDKEERDFLAELDAGKFGIERIPNTSSDYQAKEDRDLAAFKNYLRSDSFKTLNAEASK